jgi:hypothetical protein
LEPQRVEIPANSTRAELQGETADGKKLRIQIKVSPYSSSFPYRSGWRWGVEGGEPRTVLTRLAVYLGQEPLFIPVSAYADLSNVRTVSLQVRGKGYVITIAGGDAAGSYRAELQFEGAYVRKKKVVHGGFPDQAWEETTYAFNNQER